MATREVFAEQDFARGVAVSEPFDAPGPENRLRVALDRSGLAALPAGEHCLDLDIEYTLDGTTWRRLASLQVAGGEAVGAGGAVVTHAHAWGMWLRGRNTATRKLRFAVRAARALRCSVVAEWVEGAEPLPREPRRSAAFAQASDAGAEGVTGLTQELTIGSDPQRVLLAFCGVDDNEAADPTFGCTWDGTGLSTVGTVLVVDVPTGQDVHLDARYLVAPDAITADLVFSGVSTSHRVYFGWLVAYGVDQATPFGTVGKNSHVGTTTPATGSCTGSDGGLSVGWVFCLRSGSPTLTDGGTQTPRCEEEGIASRVAGSIATIAGSGTTAFEWAIGGGGTLTGWGVWAIPLLASATPALEQTAYRFREDDGDEDGASAVAAENTPVSRAQEEPTRLRVQVAETGDADVPSAQFQLEYRKVGSATGQWHKL